MESGGNGQPLPSRPCPAGQGRVKGDIYSHLAQGKKEKEGKNVLGGIGSVRILGMERAS